MRSVSDFSEIKNQDDCIVEEFLQRQKATYLLDFHDLIKFFGAGGGAKAVLCGDHPGGKISISDGDGGHVAERHAKVTRRGSTVRFRCGRTRFARSEMRWSTIFLAGERLRISMRRGGVI